MTGLRVRSFSGGATVEVRLRPRSSRPGISGVREGVLELNVGAPPVEGRANEAAGKLLAEIIGVPPSRVRLKSGAKSRSKVFAVEGEEAGTVLRRLEKAAETP